MITYNSKLWMSIIFDLRKDYAFRRVLPYLLFIIFYTSVISWIFTEFIHLADDNLFREFSVVYSILGFVISLLLAFRTNTAYDRWWEGRKALGSLTNYSRSIALKLSSILSPNDKNNRKYFLSLMCSFNLSLKNRLQNLPEDETHLNLVNQQNPKHLPLAIMLKINLFFEELRKEKKLNEIQYLHLSGSINEIINVCGIAERIKSTPIPYSYSTFIKKFIAIYILTLPFAWSSTFGYTSIFAVAIVLYVFMGLEMLAEEIENPFGLDKNDLPLEEVVYNINTQIKEILEGFQKK